METARAQWREEQQRQAAFRRPPARRQRVPHRRQPPPPLPRPASGSRQAALRSIPQHRVRLLQRGPTWPSSSPRSRPPCRGAAATAYLQQRGIPLALAQQLGVGYAAPGTWPHAARDWRGGRVVFPHTTPDGRLVNLYGRAVGTAEQVPKAKRHDHLPGAKGYFNAAALQAGAGPLWVCEGAFDALALLAAGVSRVWWRSLACRAGAGTGRGRCVGWSSPSMPMPPGSSSGASSPGRRRCGGSSVAVLPASGLWRAQRCERGVGRWDPRGGRVVPTSRGDRSAARSSCGPPRGLGGARGDHARGRSSPARRRRTAGMGGTPDPAGGVVTPGTTPRTGHGPPAHAKARSSARYGASWNEQG